MRRRNLTKIPKFSLVAMLVVIAAGCNGDSSGGMSTDTNGAKDAAADDVLGANDMAANDTRSP